MLPGLRTRGRGRRRRASSWGSTPYLTNPPSVPTTHQRGRSSRQMRLVSAWNSTSSNSMTIRPCPPLSTPGQGAGASQADSRRHGPSPSCSAWSIRCAPSRAGSSPPRPPGPARSAARRSGRPSSRTAAGGRSGPGQHALSVRIVPIPAPVVEDREHPARGVAGGDHPVGLGGRQRHHLVHDAVLARLRAPGRPARRASRAGVAMTTRSVTGSASPRRGRQIPGHPRSRPPRRGSGIAGDDSVQPHLRLSADQRAMGGRPRARGPRRPWRSWHVLKRSREPHIHRPARSSDRRIRSAPGRVLGADGGPISLPHGHSPN